jgi:hypothetical protein
LSPTHRGQKNNVDTIVIDIIEIDFGLGVVWTCQMTFGDRRDLIYLPTYNTQKEIPELTGCILATLNHHD